MGFGGQQQIGNRFGGGGSFPGDQNAGGGTNLADLFRQNIGAPQPIGTTQQPNQLFTLLQSLMGNQGQPTAQPPQQTGGGQIPIVDPNIAPPRPGGFGDFGGGGGINPLPPQFGGGTNLNQLTNPFQGLVNQRFIR